MYTYRYLKIYLDPVFGIFFRLLAICFLLFCCDLAQAVLEFRSLSANIESPKLKSAQSPRGGDIQLFAPFFLYIYSNVNT